MMKRSRFSFAALASIAAAACLAVAHASQAAYSAVRNVISTWAHFLCSPEQRPARNEQWPRVTQVSPSAFRQYRAARERPTVTRRWCWPSKLRVVLACPLVRGAL